MIIVDLKQFIIKNKLFTLTEAFVELYNLTNRGQVHEIYGIVKLERCHKSKIQNFYLFCTYPITKLFLVLHNVYVILKGQQKIVFYFNNYIDWNQLNKLYDFNWLNKGIPNADAVAYIIGLILSKITNLR